MSMTTIETPKRLCKDCRNFRPFTQFILVWNFKGPVSLSKCAAFPSPVDGSPNKFCDLERTDSHGQCGKEGKLWCPSRT